MEPASSEPLVALPICAHPAGCKISKNLRPNGFCWRHDPAMSLEAREAEARARGLVRLAEEHRELATSCKLRTWAQIVRVLEAGVSRLMAGESADPRWALALAALLRVSADVLPEYQAERARAEVSRRAQDNAIRIQRWQTVPEKKAAVGS